MRDIRCDPCKRKNGVREVDSEDVWCGHTFEASYIESLQSKLTDIERDRQALGMAIEDEGPQPEYHREIMARHRREWPILWAAIDALLQTEREK